VQAEAFSTRKKKGGNFVKTSLTAQAKKGQSSHKYNLIPEAARRKPQRLARRPVYRKKGKGSSSPSSNASKKKEKGQNPFGDRKIKSETQTLLPPWQKEGRQEGNNPKLAEMGGENMNSLKGVDLLALRNHTLLADAKKKRGEEESQKIAVMSLREERKR